MAWRMARMARAKSGSFKARKAIPTDVREDYQTLYGVRREALFRAPPDCTPQQAKSLHAAWLGEIESRIAALRAQKLGGGHDLTQREARALAGEWYHWLVGQHENNPGYRRFVDQHETDDWIAAQWAVMDELEMAVGGDPREIDWSAPEVRREWHPIIIDHAKAAQFLTSKGEVLTPAAMDTFLDEVLSEFLTATRLLSRRAGGDYSPDQHSQTLPAYDRPKALNGRKASKSSHAAKGGQTGYGLFEAFVKARKPAASTVDSWGRVLTALDAHLKTNGWNINDVDPDEAQRWATSLVGSGNPRRSAYTVRNTYVKAARTVLAWAIRQKLIASNPFADVLIDVPRRAQTREDGKAFSEAEQQTILKAALAIQDTQRPFKAACRWVPWLCAYSGARGGELTQLRGQDIEQRHGKAAGIVFSYAVMKLTPDAGTVKGLIARTVPIHEHLIEQGFLEYVKGCGKGPLFYSTKARSRCSDRRTKQKPDDDNPLKPMRSPAVQMRGKLAQWVRKLGVTDKEIQPLHAWRHTFKQRAARAKIEKVMRDAICGHAPKGVSDAYELPRAEDMANALKQFPRYKIDD